MRYFASLMLIVMPLGIFAQQTAKDATDTYNQGAVAFNNKSYKEAIDALNKCIEICKTLNIEADTMIQGLKLKAETILPGSYYYYATSIYKTDLESAIVNTEKAAEVAVILGNNDIKQKSTKLMPQLLKVKGTNFYKLKDFDNALLNYNKALELNPKYAEMYFNIGVVYKDQLKETEMRQAFDKAIEVAKSISDSKTQTNAVDAAKSFYYNKGVLLSQAKDFIAAADAYKIALSYDEGYDIAYQPYVSALNEIQKYAEAEVLAQKGISLQTITEERKSNLYFEMGRASQGKKDITSACASYRRVTIGAYVQAAKYQVEQVLKCTN